MLKTFADTEEWFQALYGHKVRHFVYNSSQLNKLCGTTSSLAGDR